ncbi:MAG: AAA family ATPase [Candidatus Omnitrophota bacterium]
MSYTIAIAGKGGTGKSTLASLIVLSLAQKKAGSILAIDADPNSTLAEFLGVTIKTDMGRIIDDISKNQDKIPAGMSKESFIEYRIEQEALEETDNFDILTMGKPEGPGCYCYANNALRNITEKLIKNYDFIIIDNEAGLEHISRRTTRKADCLIINSDNSVAGLRAAKKILDLVSDLDIKYRNKYLIINRLRNEAELLKENIEKLNIEYIGSIPEEEAILKISANGSSLENLKKDSIIFKSLRNLEGKIYGN